MILRSGGPEGDDFFEKMVLTFQQLLLHAEKFGRFLFHGTMSTDPAML
jgi:hypothetical protein